MADGSDIPSFSAGVLPAAVELTVRVDHCALFAPERGAVGADAERFRQRYKKAVRYGTLVEFGEALGVFGAVADGVLVPEAVVVDESEMEAGSAAWERQSRGRR